LNGALGALFRRVDFGFKGARLEVLEIEWDFTSGGKSLPWALCDANGLDWEVTVKICRFLLSLS
jgi:hypothetical protein